MKKMLLVCIVLLVLGMAEMPYGYYTFLRLVVFSFSMVFILQRERQFEVTYWLLFLALTALLFNPILVVPLDRDGWRFVDFVVAGIFAWKWYQLHLKGLTAFRGKESDDVEKSELAISPVNISPNPVIARLILFFSIVISLAAISTLIYVYLIPK